MTVVYVHYSLGKWHKLVKLIAERGSLFLTVLTNHPKIDGLRTPPEFIVFYSSVVWP